jgi:hypothetical protein
MRTVYLAGANRSTLPAVAGKHVLISYHGEAMSQRALLAARAARKVAGLILDCGAFTAWSKGQPVDLAGYIAFVREAIAAGQLDHAIALDVIPGAPGRAPSADEVAAAKAETFANLDAMRAAGIPTARLLPVATLHDADWQGTIGAYLAMGFTYIALGGCAKAGKAEAQAWLDAVFAAFPGVDFHLLGITRAWADHYPARSADSTSWLQLAKNRHAEGGRGLAANAYVAKGLSTADYLRHRPTAEVACGGGADLSDATLRAVGAFGMTRKAAGGAGAFLPTAAKAIDGAILDLVARHGYGDGEEIDLGLMAEFVADEVARGAAVAPAFAWTAADAATNRAFRARFAPAVVVTEGGQLAWDFLAV